MAVSSRSLARALGRTVGPRSVLHKPTSVSGALRRGDHGHSDGTVAAPFHRLPAPTKPVCVRARGCPPLPFSLLALLVLWHDL